jgi:tripartite tricarboxylate transporter TctB family protein
MDILEKIRRDILGATIFFVFGITLWFLIYIFVPGGNGFEVDARFFPKFISILTILLSVIYFSASVIKYNVLKKAEEQIKSENKAILIDEVRPYIIFIIMIFYTFLFERIGYLTSTFIISTLTLYYLGIRKIHKYLIIFGVVLIIFILFEKVLNVQLP